MKNTLLLISLGIFFCSCMPMPNAENSKLAFRAPNSITEKVAREAFSSELQMAQRTYVSSVLMEVFDAKGTASETYINENIGRKVEFGGACDQYEPSDIGTATANYEYVEHRCYNGIGVVQKSTNNPMRYAIGTKVCEKLAVDRLTAVRTRLFGASWPKPDTTNVKKVWEQFYPAEELDVGVAGALVNISNHTINDEKAWQAIIVAVCSSPQWQTY